MPVVSNRSQADMVRLVLAEAKRSGVRMTEAQAKKALGEAVASSLDPTSALADALARLSLPASTSRTLASYVKAQRAAADKSKPVTPATRKALGEAWRANASGASWKSPAEGMPVGVRFVRVELARERHPDGFTYTALIPVGALAPGAKPKDPNEATSFFVERSGGFAGMTQVTGPISLEKVATNARELRALLGRDDDKLGALIAEAFPGGYTRSTPPSLAKVKKRGDGDFDVTLQLVHFRTGKVHDEVTLVVDGSARIKRPDIDEPGGVPADLVRRMIEALHANMAGLSWRRDDSLPVGVRYERVELMRERHPDGYAYTALVPAGVVRPGAPVDLSDVKSFFVERAGGLAGMTRVAGPISLEMRGGVTTEAVGEEGADDGGFRRTTMALGEEGQGRPGRGRGRITTLAVGEEGGDGGWGRGRGGITTEAVGEGS